MTGRKIAITLMVAAVVIGGGLGAYAATGADDSAYPGQTQEVAPGETFAITLESNPTTGYSWQAQYDQTLLELVDQTFEPSSDLAGAGGQETLVFKALQNGNTKVTTVYKRPWEDTSIKTQVFDVKISG